MRRGTVGRRKRKKEAIISLQNKEALAYQSRDLGGSSTSPDHREELLLLLLLVTGNY